MIDKEMLEIVECKQCRRKEYYGGMHWYEGKTMCRRCMYDIWRTLTGWEPGERDYVFPVYSDGVNYTLKTEEVTT